MNRTSQDMHLEHERFDPCGITDEDTEQLTEEFIQQFPGLFVGGFYNPELIYENEDYLEFRCNYDNYGHDEENDSWTWYYDITTKRFYH